MHTRECVCACIHASWACIGLRIHTWTTGYTSTHFKQCFLYTIIIFRLSKASGQCARTQGQCTIENFVEFFHQFLLSQYRYGGKFTFNFFKKNKNLFSADFILLNDFHQPFFLLSIQFFLLLHRNRKSKFNVILKRFICSFQFSYIYSKRRDGVTNEIHPLWIFLNEIYFVVDEKWQKNQIVDNCYDVAYMIVVFGEVSLCSQFGDIEKRQHSTNFWYSLDVKHGPLGQWPNQPVYVDVA